MAVGASIHEPQLARRGAPMEGLELCRELQRGDGLGFTEFVRRWEADIFRIAYRITGDHATAEDVRQTIFLRLLENPALVRRVRTLAPWLRRAAVNEAINAIRGRRRLVNGLREQSIRGQHEETLINTDLDSAIITNATFTGAFYNTSGSTRFPGGFDTDAQGVILVNRQGGQNFVGVNLSGIDLYQWDVGSSNFNGANLSGANFVEMFAGD